MWGRHSGVRGSLVTEQGRKMQSKAEHSRAKQSKQGKAQQSKAKQSKARQSKAKQSKWHPAAKQNQFLKPGMSFECSATHSWEWNIPQCFLFGPIAFSWRACPLLLQVQVIVTDAGKFYPKHNDLAQALGVLERGWEFALRLRSFLNFCMPVSCPWVYPNVFPVIGVW